MAIGNVRLPVDVEQGAEGGPRFKTIINVSSAGTEQRVGEWDQARGEWDISYGIRDATELHAVITLFRSRQGRLTPFRFKDWSDFATTHFEAQGTGDGVTAAFPMYNSYNDTALLYTRRIYLPVSGTVTVKVDGVTKTETTHYTISYNTDPQGVITFTGGNIPTAGQAITASFEFDIPVRFDDDVLKVRMMRADDDGTKVSRIGSINIVEVLDE